MYKKLNKAIGTTVDGFDTMVTPVRTSLAKRFPILFAMLTTLGVIMTFLGIEQLLLSLDLLERYPVIILGVGIGILTFTGTLYKKLL